VRGKLTLAGLDPRDPAGSVLDAIYAIVADAPHDMIEKWDKKLIMEGAKAWPERDTWGVLPEHRRLSGGLMSNSRGAEAPQRHTEIEPTPGIERHGLGIKRGDGRAV
jgi:hypothetical protein